MDIHRIEFWSEETFVTNELPVPVIVQVRKKKLHLIYELLMDN
jgi:hypothetical protein